MKIYIAGPSSDLSLVELWIERCREDGQTITYDWPAFVRHVARTEGHSSNPTPAVVGRDDFTAALNERRRTWALANLDGIMAADVFWLLVDKDTASFGSWTELGYALGERKRFGFPRVLISGHVYGSIFTALGRCFSTHEEAFAALKTIEEGYTERRTP